MLASLSLHAPYEREVITEPYLIKRLSKYSKNGGWMHMQLPVKPTIVKKGNESYKSSYNRYSRKENVYRAVLKDDKERILDEILSVIENA